MFLSTPRTGLPLAKYDKFSAHRWQARSWMFVDPKKDAETSKILRDEGWKTDQAVTDELGGDFNENIDIIKATEPRVEDTYLEAKYADPTGPETTEGGDVQRTALNGAQVSSMVEISTSVSEGTLSLEAGKAMLVAAFPEVPEALLDEMLVVPDNPPTGDTDEPQDEETTPTD